MNDGVRIDRADSSLDASQFIRRHKVGLVEKHHVGEGHAQGQKFIRIAG